VFAGCTIRQFAGNGVTLRGTGHRLLACDVYSMGRGGVVLSGGNRKTLEPGELLVENCDIHTLSRIDHTYTPAVLVDGVGHRVVHNRLHDLASSALRVGGNDHLIAYNEVFRAVLESDDQGGADMYGNPTYRGNRYLFNYWHHIGAPYGPLAADSKLGQAGIRLDDAICGTLIYGNIFERSSSGRTGFGAIQIHGGKDNVIDNNVFVDCPVAVSFTAWNDKHWNGFVKDSLIDPAIDAVLYQTRYPELGRLSDNLNANQVWRNLVVRCGEFTRRDPKTSTFLGNIVTNDAAFRFQAAAPRFEHPGLAPIPIAEIGIYPDALRPGRP
jgi:hypothetical protein